MSDARIDQWLWSVRIFKSRTQANDACKKGKVLINGVKAKPSATVQPDDHVKVGKDKFEYEYKVQKVIKKRVGAPLARECYEDITPEEELKKFERWHVAGSKGEYREKGTGRPTKKERREIEKFKGL